MSGKIEVGPEGNLDLHPTHHQHCHHHNNQYCHHHNHQHCHHHNDQGMNWQWQERSRQSRWVNWKAKAGLKRSPTAQHLHCILTQYLHSSFEFKLYLRCTPNQHLHSSFEFTLYKRCTPKQNWHEIVGLPPRLASFKIISFESVCSANKIFSKKGIFGTKTLISALFGPFQALFGPFLTLFNGKITPFLALVGEIFTPFPLSVSTSS